MISAEEWARAILRHRIADAAELIGSTYAGQQALAIHGPELLAEHVPAALHNCPAGTDDDWQAAAAAAYRAARERWIS